VSADDDGVATALDVATGDTLWEHAYDNAASYHPQGSDGRYLVPTSPSTVSGIDARTGGDLFTFDIDSPSVTVIGSTPNVFYEDGSPLQPLRARSWSNGEVVWALDYLDLGFYDLGLYDFSVAGAT